MNRTKPWRLMAISTGPTMTTPAATLLHHRDQWTIADAGYGNPASEKPATPTVGATAIPSAVAKMKIGTSCARPKVGSKRVRRSNQSDSSAPPASPAPLISATSMG